MERIKPASLKHLLAHQVAQKNEMDDDVVLRVVDHQFEEALDALSQCNSLELSGFGKFFFNQKRAQKKMEKMLSQKTFFESRAANENLSTRVRESAKFKLNQVVQNIEYLKSKLNAD